MKLPEDVRKQARVAYKLFATNPYHRSLYFKRVHETEPIFSPLESAEAIALSASSSPTT